ncbi:hypothetical protein [Tannockella kyphosi]|uniref:hypothetical protein n=1 Tax=Tannockella kyphosi TaxID=2899121 RepID=UPI00201329A9|nr:hypothetical protein [Tannockella kyphosi]
MDRRKIKATSYHDFLTGYIKLVENLLDCCENKIQEGIENEGAQAYRDFIDAVYDFEISLASLCLVLRKMDENNFIHLTQQIRYDVNSLIHSNRFRFLSKYSLEVYSKRGKEIVDLQALLKYAKQCNLQ